MKAPIVVLDAANAVGRGVVQAAVAAAWPVIAVSADAAALDELQRSHRGADLTVLRGSTADDAKSAEAIGALNQAKGYLQRYLSKNITLRWLPELEFRLDTTTRHAARINDLLKTIERQPSSGQTDDVSD